MLTEGLKSTDPLLSIMGHGAFILSLLTFQNLSEVLPSRGGIRPGSRAVLVLYLLDGARVKI